MAEVLHPDLLASPFRPPALYPYKIAHVMKMGCGEPTWPSSVCTRYHMCHRCQAIKRNMSYYCLLNIIANLNTRHQQALAAYDNLYERYQELLASQSAG